jgi:putative RecB family exonuclease
MEGVEAFLGSRVHEVLEKLYRDLLNGKRNSNQELLDYYDRQWERHWDEKRVRIVRTEYAPEHYYKAGWLCIDSYYKRYQPFDQDRTLGIEVRVNFTLNHDPAYRMQGYIDRLARGEDGVWEIHDYKTSSSLPTQEEVAEKPQLALYQIGVQQKWPQIQEVRLVWHYLRFDTALSTMWNADRLRELQASTRQSIDQIEGDVGFSPRESRLCDWCDFQDRCPLKKHPLKTSDMTPQQLVEDDGVKLVDRYAALKDQEREIKARIDEAKKQLLEYASHEGTSVIAGSQHLASVRFHKKLKFPESGAPKRDELETLLRQAGKWDKISILSTAILDKALRQEQWDQNLTEKIMAFAMEREEAQIRLRDKNKEK